MLLKKVILSLFGLAASFTPSINPAVSSVGKIIKQRLDNEVATLYELENINRKEVPCAVFFTGLNSLIPGDIYSEFLTQMAQQGVSTYVAESDQDNTNDLVDDLIDKYANVTVVGHSSGCLSAIIACNNNKEIKSAVLLDPVDNSMLVSELRGKPLILKNVENLLFLNAAKSYEWGSSPFNFNIPFIPGFKISNKNLKLKKGSSKTIEAINFGHTDMLDDTWADFMHNSVSKGSEDRDSTVLSEYKFWLGTTIKDFITGHQQQEVVKSANETLQEAASEIGTFVNEISGKMSIKAAEIINSRKQRKGANMGVLYRRD